MTNNADPGQLADREVTDQPAHVHPHKTIRAFSDRLQKHCIIYADYIDAQRRPCSDRMDPLKSVNRGV